MNAISFALNPLAPFRLDLTVWVLRRRVDNVMDRWDGETYRRVLLMKGKPLAVAVIQTGPPEKPYLEISATGEGLPAEAEVQVKATMERMLGLQVNLSQFYQLSARDPKLGELVHRFIGMRPPRFETLFEALVNAFACQQVSLTLGIRLLNRLAETYAPAVQDDESRFHAFPSAEILAEVDPEGLRTIGLSRQKARAIIELASAVAEGRLDLDEISGMDDEAAVAHLRKIRGVGRWTAEYVLLRGLGRLHVFPGDDVGARRNLERWLGLTESLDYEGVHRLIGSWKSHGGLIYFHLLLKRLEEAQYIRATTAFRGNILKGEQPQVEENKKNDSSETRL